MSEIKTVLNFFDKNNGLAGVIKDLKEVKKLQAEINKQKGGVGSDNLKERAAALKEIARLQKLLDAARKKGNETKKKSLTIEQELVKVQEKDRQVKKKLKVARSEKFRQLQETNLALRNQNKLVKADIVENSKLSSVYERQSAKLNRLRKELKNLILTEGTGTAKTKKLALEVGKLDTKLKAADASAGQFQRNVGNYPKGLGKAIGALKNFAGALGITAGIAGLVRGIGAAINIAKDFEQGNANLAAVLGKTKDEVSTLTEDAKRLGAATAFSATQVSGLQVEFAKLGFNEQEILNATEATLSLAAATGSDLGEAAAIAGATLGGFGLGAEETQRVVDVMAKSFSTSALDIEKFKESMKNAAPAAKAVGISVEETTALLGTLANAGISGSRAGNSLKTSFINLNKAGLTLEQGLEKVAKSEDKLGTAAKLVGKNAAASFLVLSEGVDVTKELTIGLNNAGGAAEKMAKEQLNTLQGSLTILNSAWEGFVLSLLSGDSAFSKMSRSIVEGTTALLGFLTASEDATEVSFETAMALKQEANESQNLLDEYESLVKDGVTPTKEEKEKLDIITLQLKDRLGESVVAINEETGAFELNTDAVREQIKLKRFASDEEAATLASRLKGVQEEIKAIESQKKTEERVQKIRAKQADELLEERRKRSKENAKAGINQTKVFKEEKEARAAQVKSANNLIDANKKLQDQRDKEADLIEKLKKLNFTAADAEALFAVKKKKTIEEEIVLIEGKIKSTKGLTDAQKAALELEKLRLQGLINEQEERDEILNRMEKSENDFFESQLKKEQQELRAVEDHYFSLIQKADEFGFDSTQLEEDRQAELDAIRKKYRDKEIADNKALMEELEAQAALEIAKDKAAKEKAAKDAEKAEKERKKQQEEIIKESKEAVDTVIDDLTRESQARIEALDRQINAEKDFLSDNENLSAHEIELRRKKQVELEAERIEEQKRLEKLAKTQAFFDLVAAFASSGDGQGAVGKATSAMAAAEVYSQGFHDGGYTGDGNEYKEAGVVHKGEFVNTKKQTSEYGMKGWTAKDFDGAVKDGYFNQFTDSNMFADQNAKFLSVQNNQVGYDFKKLESRLDSVVDAVSNIQSSDFAIQDGYFIKTKHSKGSTLITKKKLG